MRSLLSYTRSLYWTLGIVYILTGLFVAVRSFGPHGPTAGPHAAAMVFAIGLLSVALGALSCFAAQAFRHRNVFSKPLIAMNSLVTLLLFPFGTVAGTVGLYWCFSPKMREAEPLVEAFEHQSKPGDGTHRWIQKAAPVAAIVIWIGSLSWAAWWGRAHGLPARGAINGLLLLFLCEWIAVFFHELGHAVAGWVSEMQLASFLVGPFLAQKRAGRWKFQFSVAGILNSGGAVATVPLHLKRLRQRMAFEVAGGPVASLVTAVAAFLVLLMMPGSAYAAWWKVPAVVAAISAGATVLNLIPFRFAAGVSDGALLVQLFRGGQFADLREALKMVGSTTVTPTRPRDLDPRALADGLRAGVGTPQEGSLQLLQLICAVDRGELKQAREHLEASLQRIPAPEKATNAGCAAEMAFYMAYLDGDAERAGKWLRDAEQLAATRKYPLAGDSDYWRALTAVREAEGQNRQAEEAYQQAQQLLEKKPATGLYQFERELLQTVRKGEWVRRQDSVLSEAPV
jgi:Peptidase family M50